MKNLDLNAFKVVIVYTMDERDIREDLIEAKKSEVKGIINRKIWYTVCANYIPDSANFSGGRLIMNLKNSRIPDEMEKEQHVSKGLRDIYKEYMVHDVNTLRI